MLNISNVSNKNCLHLKTNFSPYENIAKLFFSSDHWCPMTTVKVKHLTHHISYLIMVTRPNRIRDTSLDFKPQTDLVRGRIFADVFCKKKTKYLSNIFIWKTNNECYSCCWCCVSLETSKEICFLQM